MEFKDGDTITVNGKPCRIEGGALVPVVSKGPLGGEMRLITDLKSHDFFDGKTVYLQLHTVGANDGETIRARYNHEDCKLAPNIINVPIDAIIETNIPPRPTFTLMTAGEAARLPDIVRRWVAVKVQSLNSTYATMRIAEDSYLNGNDQILLIEGVDL